MLGRARVGAVMLAGRTVVMQLVVLGGNVYLTRRLSPADFGAFALVQTTMTFFELIGDGGLGGALVAEKTTPDRRTLSSVFWAQTMLVSATVVVAWLVSGSLPRLWPTLPAEGPTLLRALSLTLLLTALRAPCGIMMERQLQYGRIVVIDVTTRSVYYAVAVAMASAGLGPKALVGAVLAQGLAGTVLAHLLSPFRPQLVLDWERVKGLLRYGFTMQSRGFISYISGLVTPVYAGGVLGRAALGLNNWALGVATFPMEVVNIVSRVSFPLYSQLRDDRPKLLLALTQAVRTVATASFFFAALVGALGPQLVRVIYTDKWLPALVPLYAYTASMVLGVSAPVVASLLDAMGKPQIISRLSLFWVTLNWVVVTVAMRVSPGLTVFALATCVHIVVGNVLVLVVLRREVPELRLARILRGPAAGALAVLAAGRPLQAHVTGPFSLTGAVVALAAAYLTGAALVDPAMRDLIRQQAHRLRRR